MHVTSVVFIPQSRCRLPRETGETLEECVAREVMEETGLKIKK